MTEEPRRQGLLSRAERFLLEKGLAKYWILGLLLFVAPMVLTALFYDYVEDSPIGGFLEEALGGLQERAKSVEGLGNLAVRIAATFALILANNLVVALIMALSSVTIVLPVAVIAFNGLLNGYVVGAVLRGSLTLPEGGLAARDVSPIDVFAALAPHGVIEIPALALLVAPLMAVNSLSYKEAVKTSISLVPVVAVLLAVAALIESTITLIGLSIVQAVSGTA